MNEKRIKLGLDNSEIEGELRKVDQLQRSNNASAIEGQSKYNSTIGETNSLLSESNRSLEDFGRAANQYSNIDLLGNSLASIDSFSTKLENISRELKELNNSSPYELELKLNQSNNNNEQNSNSDVAGSENDELVEITRSGFENIEETLRSSNSSSNESESSFDSNSYVFLNIKDGVENIYHFLQTKELNKGQAELIGENEVNVNNEDDGGGGGGGKGKNGSGSAGRGANSALAATASRNEIYALASLATLIPVVGAGIGAILNRLLQAGSELSANRDKFYATSGSYTGLNSLNAIGFSSAESFEAQVEYRKAYDRLAEEDLYAEKGFNINRGNLAALARSLRTNNDYTFGADGEAGYLTAGGAVEELLNALVPVVGRDNSRAYIEEYLEILVSLNREQLNASGRVENILNTEVIQSFAALGREFQNPEYLANVISGISSGLRSASSPQLEALQFSTLQALNPDASLWDLYKMRQNPFSEENREYFGNYVRNIVGVSGGGEEAYFNIESAFPSLKGNYNAIEAIVDAVRGNRPFNLDFLDQEGFDIREEALRSTSLMQSLTATQEDRLAKIGEGLINAYGDVIAKVEEVVKKADRWFGGDSSSGGGRSQGAALNEIADNTQQIATSLNNRNNLLPSNGYGTTIPKNPVKK